MRPDCTHPTELQDFQSEVLAHTKSLSSPALREEGQSKPKRCFSQTVPCAWPLRHLPHPPSTLDLLHRPMTSVWKVKKPLQLFVPSFIVLFSGNRYKRIKPTSRPRENLPSHPPPSNRHRSANARSSSAALLSSPPKEPASCFHGNLDLKAEAGINISPAANTKTTGPYTLLTAGLLSCKVKTAIAKLQTSAGWGVSSGQTGTGKTLRQHKR